jgi:hypothetical protein
MVRNGHCDAVSVYFRVGDKDGVGEEAGGGYVVVLEDAVVLGLATAVSFAGWANAHAEMLQRSKNSVHSRSGVPGVGIAWSHS